MPNSDPAAPTGTVSRRPRIVAVLTCFNRKALTLACLDALAVTAGRAQVDLEAVVVDDASPDGTAAAVRERFPWVEVIEGSGALFWNRGMHLGFGRALQREADHYLWLNDDTHLVPEALPRLLAQHAALTRSLGAPAILVGATAERDTARVSYGGRVVASRLRPFNYRLVHDERQPVRCDAIEGNCVLISREVAARVGNLDPVFEHAMGDTDYGLRARSLGIPSYVAGGIVGHCSQNALRGTYFDATLPLARRWKLIRSRKGLPVRSWLHFCRRHGGLAWPLHFSWPYAKVLLTGLRGGLTGRSDGDRSAKLT
ncbi:MAG: glycosyltransferase family 2 protein [Burkholderiales bacterium]|nr:glycosyltransferase family 2 protein [Burkholderiales bacterium]